MAAYISIEYNFKRKKIHAPLTALDSYRPFYLCFKHLFFKSCKTGCLTFKKNERSKLLEMISGGRINIGQKVTPKKREMRVLKMTRVYPVFSGADSRFSEALIRLDMRKRRKWRNVGRSYREGKRGERGEPIQFS